MKKEFITKADGVPEAIGPYSLAVQVQGPRRHITLSGQLPLDAEGKLIEGGIEAQTKQVLHNIEQVLRTTQASLKDVVRVFVLLTDLNDFDRMNGEYRKWFPDDKPARAVWESPHLPKGALVEMIAEAHAPEEPIPEAAPEFPPKLIMGDPDLRRRTRHMRPRRETED